jgi:predicted nuclease of predicted toxin-antitoxin system
MNIWIDAQLSPVIAALINESFPEVKANSVKSLGLRDASDIEIFQKAKAAKAVIMTKDNDFINLLNHFGPPPKIILITSGNTSNKKLKETLSLHMPTIIKFLNEGENMVEVKN